MIINIGNSDEWDFNIKTILLEIANLLTIERSCQVTISCTLTVSDGLKMQTLDRSDCVRWAEILWLNPLCEINFEPEELTNAYILGEAFNDAIKQKCIDANYRPISAIQFHMNFEK